MTLLQRAEDYYYTLSSAHLAQTGSHYYIVPANKTSAGLSGGQFVLGNCILISEAFKGSPLHNQFSD